MGRAFVGDGLRALKTQGTHIDAGQALLRESTIDTHLSIVMTVHSLPRARLEEPLHQLGATDAERILQTLIRPGTVAIQG